MFRASLRNSFGQKWGYRRQFGGATANIRSTISEIRPEWYSLIGGVRAFSLSGRPVAAVAPDSERPAL
jgi:hypothetical protein